MYIGGFAVRAYYENNRSVIATQRAFRIHFGGIPRAESIPSANTIKLWIRHLEETESTLCRLGHGAPRTVRTPENLQLVRESIEQSPRRSARKHAVALGISDRSLRRILHKDLSWLKNMIWEMYGFSKTELKRTQLEFHLLSCDKCFLGV